MKFLQLLTIIVLLFEVKKIAANQNKENVRNVSFSIEKIWQNYRRKDECCARDCKNAVNRDDTWIDDVQEYYTGCRLAHWKFRGKAYHLADTVMKSFEVYLTKLIFFDNSNSTLLISSSGATLHTLKKCNRLNQSAMNIIIEFEKVFPDVVNDLTSIASTFSDHIGHLINTFNDAVHDLSCVFGNYMKKFLKNCQTTGCTAGVNFAPTLKSCQKLMNTVALIAETLLNGGEASPEAQEAVLVLTFIYWYLAIGVQGINSCVQDILFDSDFETPSTIKSISIAFDYVLVALAQAVQGVVRPFNVTIREMLISFVNITLALNTSVKTDLGLFDGVDITVAEITRSLFKGVEVNFANSKSNILNGVKNLSK